MSEIWVLLIEYCPPLAVVVRVPSESCELCEGHVPLLRDSRQEVAQTEVHRSGPQIR
jgi:hypothetical protein